MATEKDRQDLLSERLVQDFCERYGVGTRGRWPMMRAWLVIEIAAELRRERVDERLMPTANIKELATR